MRLSSSSVSKPVLIMLSGIALFHPEHRGKVCNFIDFLQLLMNTNCSAWLLHHTQGFSLDKGAGHVVVPVCKEHIHGAIRR